MNCVTFVNTITSTEGVTWGYTNEITIKVLLRVVTLIFVFLCHVTYKIVFK